MMTFSSKPSVETDEKSYSLSIRRNGRRKARREDAFALIDTTAEHMANDGALFQSYLDVQAHLTATRSATPFSSRRRGRRQPC